MLWNWLCRRWYVPDWHTRVRQFAPSDRPRSLAPTVRFVILPSAGASKRWCRKSLALPHASCAPPQFGLGRTLCCLYRLRASLPKPRPIWLSRSSTTIVALVHGSACRQGWTRRGPESRVQRCRRPRQMGAFVSQSHRISNNFSVWNEYLGLSPLIPVPLNPMSRIQILMIIIGIDKNISMLVAEFRVRELRVVEMG